MEDYFSEERDFIEEINDLAGNNDISLRVFNALTETYLTNANDIELTAFEAAALMLYNLMTEYDLPRFVRDKDHLQQMIDGKFYLKRGESGFELLADQKNVRYGGIVYVIKPINQYVIFTDIFELIYIGVTWKTILERFIGHTEDAIKSYIKFDDWPNRLIEHLILRAMEDYLFDQYPCDSETSMIKQFIEFEISGKEKWEKKAVITNIARELFNNYFFMEIIEVHRNYDTAMPHERKLILDYSRELNGKTICGTLRPKGLNMMISPEKSGHITLPLYDIIFLVSLGFKVKKINEMIWEYYSIKIDFRTIFSVLNKFWGSWDNILELFFKPVLQTLLEDGRYQWKEIAKTLHRNPSFRTKTNFKKWFFGLNVTELEYAMSRGDYDRWNLAKMAKEIKKELADDYTVKGISVDKWNEWFIANIGMDIIAKLLEYGNVQSFRSAWIKQGRVSIYQKKFGASYTLAVKKARKRRTIELLTDEDFVHTLLESRLYWIYVKEFRFMRWQDYAVATPSQGLRNCYDFFDRLFEDDDLTTEELENLTPFNYMDNPRIYSIVNTILNS